MEHRHFNRTIKRSHLLFLLMFTLLIPMSTMAKLTSGTSSENDQSTVIHLTTSDFTPYYGFKLKDRGVFIEMIRRVFKSAGYQLKVEFLPFSRALAMVRHERVDGIAGIWFTEQRTQWLYLSDPIMPNYLGFFRHKDSNLKFNQLKDAAGKQIGTVKGYVLPDALAALHIRTDPVKSDAQNIMRLVNQRVDLILMDKGVGLDLLRRQPAQLREKIEWLEPAVSINNLYIGLDKSNSANEQVMQRFNQALQQMKQSGEYQALVTDYGLANL